MNNELNKMFVLKYHYKQLRTTFGLKPEHKQTKNKIRALILRRKEVTDPGGCYESKNQHLQKRSDDFRVLLLLDRFLNHLVDHLYLESDKLREKMCQCTSLEVKQSPLLVPHLIYHLKIYVFIQKSRVKHFDSFHSIP